MYLRGLQPGDPDRLYALDVVCFQEPFRFSRAAMRRFATAPYALVRLACAPGDGQRATGNQERLLGFAIVHLQPSPGGVTGYVATLDVEPTVRGQGIATALMRDIQLLAMAHNAQTMSLHVYAGNRPAIQLYERLGYRCRGTVADFYAPGLDALALELALMPTSLNVPE